MLWPLRSVKATMGSVVDNLKEGWWMMMVVRVLTKSEYE